MKGSDHPQREVLERYTDGSLSQLARAQVHTHLQGCESCRSELEAINDQTAPQPEVASERLYRKVDVTPLKERPVPPSESDALRRELLAAVNLRAPSVTLPKDVPLGQLTDLLLLHLRLDVTTMIDLYSRLDVAERARGALAQHAKLPKTPEEPPAKGGAEPKPPDES